MIFFDFKRIRAFRFRVGSLDRFWRASQRCAAAKDRFNSNRQRSSM